MSGGSGVGGGHQAGGVPASRQRPAAAVAAAAAAAAATSAAAATCTHRSGSCTAASTQTSCLREGRWEEREGRWRQRSEGRGGGGQRGAPPAHGRTQRCPARKRRRAHSPAPCRCAAARPPWSCLRSSGGGEARAGGEGAARARAAGRGERWGQAAAAAGGQRGAARRARSLAQFRTSEMNVDKPRYSAMAPSRAWSADRGEGETTARTASASRRAQPLPTASLGRPRQRTMKR